MWRISVRDQAAGQVLVMQPVGRLPGLDRRLEACTRVRDATADHDLSGSCARYFKYIVPQYGEEVPFHEHHMNDRTGHEQLNSFQFCNKTQKNAIFGKVYTEYTSEKTQVFD